MRPIPRGASCAVVTVVLVLVSALPSHRAAVTDPELKTKAGEAIDRGLKWLRAAQKDDGSWEHHPGLTALALTAFLRSPRAYTDQDGPFIRKPLAYLEGLAKPDGSIYDRDLPVYNTAVAVMALCASGNPKYAPLIERARAYLATQQSDEGEGYKEDDQFYGGIGYGSDERPDLSNLQLAMESLSASGLAKDDPVWQKAITFLERCQNRSESNDQEWAANDGGFVYYPGHSMAGGTKSYGSMTYAGIKSFIHAQMEPDDPRIQSALDWVGKHYTLEENPEMGAQGLYYYYHTFAKTLRIVGKTEIVDAKGQKHLWADELVRKLLSLQRDEGQWFNDKSGRWWEDNPVLVTAESVMALEEALAEPGPSKTPCPALKGAASGSEAKPTP